MSWTSTSQGRWRESQQEPLYSRLRRDIYRSLLGSFPETRAGDRLHAWIQFLRFHRRLPSKAMRYNDVLHRIKTSGEVLDPLRIFVSDKEFMKLYVTAVVGERYAVPTLAVLGDAEAIDEYEFPAQCCIKATHTSGCVILREGGEPVDIERVKSWLGINYYRVGREANYKLLKPKVIVEPLVFGDSNVQDFKIFCVHGTPRLIQVDVDRYIGHKRKYFDPEWNAQDFSIKYPLAKRSIPRPENLAEMLAVAAELSKRFWFVRIDLYSNGTQLYVGEITHCADNAGGKFLPPTAEARVSAYLFGDCRTS